MAKKIKGGKDCKTCRQLGNLKKLKDQQAVLVSQINDLEIKLHANNHNQVKQLKAGANDVPSGITDSVTQPNVKVLANLEDQQKEIEDRLSSLEAIVNGLVASVQQLIKKQKNIPAEVVPAIPQHPVKTLDGSGDIIANTKAIAEIKKNHQALKNRVSSLEKGLNDLKKKN